jgi:hypothetical protein
MNKEQMDEFLQSIGGLNIFIIKKYYEKNSKTYRNRFN